jgi:subtilisin family serine protease
MTIKNRLIPVAAMLLMLMSVIGSTAAMAKQPQLVPDRWIVYLEAPPTIHYDGGDHATLQGNGPLRSGPGLAATSPEVTGAPRLDASSPEVRAYAKWLDRERHGVLERASATLGRDLQPIHVYRYLQNGFSVNMSAEEARRLAEVPGVAGVEQDEFHYLELERGPQLIRANALWFGWLQGLGEHRGENVVIGVIDTGINWDHTFFSDDTSHTGGYEHTNPLGSQLGLCSNAGVPCNDKLIGVYDFTDEGTEGKDPGGHGSHVAATAAGNRRSVGLDFGGGANNYTLSGVAPRANIVSYKVCKDDFDEDEESECQGSAIRQALEQAIEDGVDIINYSIGSSPSDPWITIGQPQSTSFAELFLNLRSAGIMPVTSAGNSGGDGLATISTPANAPWMLSVANTTHSRVLANRATVAGRSNLVALGGSGPDMNNDLSAPVQVAEDVDPGNFLACDAFPSGAFNGAIAVVMRGSCDFRVKVNHAHDAGAVGVLVINHLPGPPILMGGLESTSIPSFMLNNGDGQNALAAIANQSSPEATIEAGVTRIVRTDWEDQVAGSSSRGPGLHAPDVMKPNIAAPGSSILAAGSDGSNSYALMSGTSMASPHIAGAVALIKSARPDWSNAMIQSALETTADAEAVTSMGQPATMVDRGAGRARLDYAVNAGLYLPISRQDFIDANPNEGGDPGQLNLAGIYAGTCTQNCEFTRTVRAIRSSTWNVTTEGDLDIQVSPSSFSLSAGASQELTITVSGDAVEVDSVLDGSIVLTPDGSGISTQRLPVGMAVMAADLPSHLSINTTANRGRATVDVDVFSSMAEAVYRSSSLVRPVRESFDLAQDPTPSDPFAGDTGTRTFLVDVPADSLLLWVETVASSAPDIDLYVGFDSAGDGQAAEGEVVCESSTPDELEECLIENPVPGTWWILVQNLEASDANAQDFVDLEYAVLTEGNDYTLVAAGPPRHEAGTMELAVAWDQPAMRRHERWLGAVGLASQGDEVADMGVIPLSIRRNTAYSPRPTAIFAGESYPAVVPASGVNDRLFFDVSPGASGINVHVQGSAGVSAQLRRMDFEEIAGHAPGSPPAAGELVTSGSGSTAGFNMSASAEPGRWYVVLDNITSNEALVDVSVEITESNPVRSQRGLWSPRDRVIYQGIEWQRAGPGFMTWYSYDADGLPVFYQGIAEINAASSAWIAPLDRISNPTGNRQLYDVIGEVSLTMINDEEMIFAWRRDGFHGSEIMSPDAARTCPDVDGSETSYSGHWFSPDELVGGTTMIVTDSVQAHIRYYFDALGVGRWLLASDPESDPLNEVLELLDYRGFCPGCEETEVDIHPVGVYTRTFESESSGTEMLDFITADPLDHAIQIEVPISKLSEPLECH